jgi:putative sterol carrier protein
MKTIHQIFNEFLPGKIQNDPMCLAETGVREKTIGIEIEGAQGGSWAFRFDGQGAVSVVPATPSADCTIETKDATFQELLAGKLNVAWAFVTRKIKVRGDSALAAKLGSGLQKLFKR